ncbi:MAG TPA: helix-turn-helix transcriptional regulator, partial [Anaerolineales bacterium]|nr:helix-turn-helix transcriptional regulator [Anaerolineales bacterium]
MDYRLSERERDVARILLRGKSNKQIALELGISNRTVEFHLRNIYAKLGVASRTEAVIKLKERDLWKTPGEGAKELLVEPTVDAASDSIENGIQSIFRRITMKKYIPAIAILVGALLLAAIVIDNQPEAASVNPTSGQVPTIPAILPTATTPTPAAPVPSLEEIHFAPHTVNGYIATIESFYIDTANLIFHVRLTGGDIAFGAENFYSRLHVGDLYDENGYMLNTSAGSGPTAADPELIQLEFRPQAHLVGDRFRGQIGFELESEPPLNETLAQFRFDIDLPIFTPRIYHPKQVVNANGLELLLDQVAVTPNFTLLYLCYTPPSFAPWMIGSQSVMEIDDRQTTLHHEKLLFGSDLGGDRRAGSEPYWSPPVKNGRCERIGFPIGSNDPVSLTLTVPELENQAPGVLLSDQLLRDYPGLSPKEAYHTYLEEHGNLYKGPWTFTVDL